MNLGRKAAALVVARNALDAIGKDMFGIDVLIRIE